MTKTVSGKDLSKIGIGTYGIGGRGHRDMSLTEKEPDDIYVDAIVRSLEAGSNFCEISLGYGHGNSLRLLADGLKASSLAREDVFITHSFYPRDLESLETMRQDLGSFHRELGTDYADSTLVTQSLLITFGERQVYDFLHDLLDTKRSRFVSLSNASPNWIQKFKAEFGDKFFAHEGHLSFEVRALQDKGVFDECQNLGVENIIWRPLRRNATLQQEWPLLSGLTEKYQRTQSQIILNWMCHKGYRPMVFSTNSEHIAENLSATDFGMAADDYQKIDEFRPAQNSFVIDWEGPRIDDDIVEVTRMEFTIDGA